MSASLRDELARIGNAFVAHSLAATGQPPATDHDPDWPSPCVVGTAANGRCQWRPLPMAAAPDFAALQRALECPIHADYVDFFGSFWSGNLPAVYADNRFELLQLWNEREFENLVANLIGHALEKRRVRQPLTLFFALVDDEEFLSIDNDSGEILLESLRIRTPRPVADDLTEFLVATDAADIYSIV